MNVEREIVDALLHWYWEEKRDLPWRMDRDPYKIWISEIMLQQTRVEAVKPYYERFLARFPDIRTVAEANEQDLLKMWEGLGYYSRVKNIQKAAQTIVEHYGGEMPREYEDVITLPGIGEYTAGAIMSIAYNRPYPAVDGNVLRVFARWYNLDLDVTKTKSKQYIGRLVSDSIPDGYASDFNQSLMDLGATICIAKYPKCDICPTSKWCKGYIDGRQAVLPVKAPKKPPVIVHVALARVKMNHNILIEQRPNQGLLADMWQFPMAEGNDPTDARDQLQKYLQVHYPTVCLTEQVLCTEEHIFSHRHWMATVYHGEINRVNEQAVLYREGEENADNRLLFKWIAHSQLKNYPLPKIYHKIIAKIDR